MGHDQERLVGSHLIGDKKFRSRLADDDRVVAIHANLKVFDPPLSPTHEGAVLNN
jgi:hypothetical protein